ncbi:MAG: M14 family zinc carboxypeptidase, partial [Acidobacteriota bacterium]|nr:M14 family zinc carboxypeptidase [Acidobacteriota bacterium]
MSQRGLRWAAIDRTPFFVVVILLLGLARTGAQSALPSPESVLGYRVGADYELATYDETVAYFQKLDAASDHMTMMQAGTSTEGRTYWYAAISSPTNLTNIDRYREIARRLAHPGAMSDDEARALAREGKVIVHIDGGLHSTEVAGPQHTMQLAYDLLAGADDPELAHIFENVILLLWPTINPDGQQMVAEWYRGNVGTPFEVAPLPRLYQEYVGHDNNRDGYMLNMIESRVMEHAWRQWEPQIIHVHHQSSPFPTRIWLPPFAEPIASQAPYLISREINMIGMAMAKGLEERGQVGATHMGTGFDAWYPGYIDYKPVFQNIASYWTETALYSYATPRFYTMNDFPRDMRDLRPQALYTSPWPGGWWRLRDAVEYMCTASMSVLDYAARYRENVLLNRYRAGRWQIEKYSKAPPHAYLVPQQQRDPVAAVELLRRLAFQGVRISQLSEAATVEGVSYPAGTWVVPMDQEYAEAARQVLDVQHYPDLRESPDGPLEQPYDAAGWTLPLQMGVTVTALMTPMSDQLRSRVRSLGMDLPAGGPATPYEAGTTDVAPFDSVPGAGFDTNAVAAAIVPPAGTLTGRGPALALSPAENNAFAALNRAWAMGARVAYSGATSAGSTAGAARGSDAAGVEPRYLVTGLTPAQQGVLVTTYALRAERATPPAGARTLTRPRVGLYRPWMASMDEGWTRWMLERYGFDVVSLSPQDVRRAPLSDLIDSLVIADEARGLLDGYATGVVPAQYEGGLGTDGVRAIDAFVRAGGTLVCFNRSTAFAIEQFGLPVKNVIEGTKRQEFFTGGSVLAVSATTTHPVMAGMPERAAIFVDGSPAFETLDGFTGEVLARYQDTGSPLLSGYLLGERFLNTRAAAL